MASKIIVFVDVFVLCCTDVIKGKNKSLKKYDLAPYRFFVVVIV
jgi:hypothetical protein